MSTLSQDLNFIRCFSRNFNHYISIVLCINFLASCYVRHWWNIKFWQNGSVDPGVLKAMNRSMVHRGPDGDGIFINNSKLVGLCHRRLSIIDLSEDASQPMSNREGDLWISFNGEIYNHKTLRKELESIGAIFKSDHSDTEVLILGYQFWGLKKIIKKN